LARGRDLAAVQAVRAYEETLESGNRLEERLRESYGLHFPELARLVPTERYARLVMEGKPRDALLADLGMSPGETAGGPIDPDDEAAVRRLAALVVAVADEQARQARAVEAATRAAAPNLATLLGPMIAARLLESAGSLAKLSRMPASTVQLLGAEKALFRHLREGSRPPKHGVLFLHASIHGSPAWARGKLARSLAAKAAIAARADAFGRSKEVGNQLRNDFERRREAVLRSGAPARKRNAPPPRAARKPARDSQARRPRRGR
jgi:nucleolar protein 56